MVRFRIPLFLVASLLITGPARAQVRSDVTALSRPPQAPTSLGTVGIEPTAVPSGLTILQDKRGFLWIGGIDGLYRYDGIDFATYRHDPQDSTSLGHTWVDALFVGSDGTLWVGTHGGGLNRYDETTNSFTRFKHDPSDPASLSENTVPAILEDSHGTLWVGTNAGLNRLDQDTGAFTHYRNDPNDPRSLSCDQVRVIYEDRRGTLWVGTGSPSLTETPTGKGGLNRFDPATGTFTRYMHDAHDETTLIHNKVMSLFEDSKGVFWVGTLGDGLHSMDRESGTFTRHRYDPSDPTKLSRPFLRGSRFNEDCSSWACGGVSFIYEDSEGILWIGGFDGGVNRYDRSASSAGSQDVRAMDHIDPTSSSLESNTIWSIAESDDGTHWIGDWGRTYKVVSSANVFSHVTRNPADPGSLEGPFVTSLYEDREGTFWVGSRRNGLNRFDRSKGTFTHLRYDPADPGSLVSNGLVGRLYEDKDGALWIVTNKGLDRFERSTGQFTHFPSNPDHPAGLGDVLSILEDRRGRFWVGGTDGLDLFDPETGKAVHHRHDPRNPESLSANFVRPILEDNFGTIWVGTERGLDRLTDGPASVKFETYLPGKAISALYEDSAGRFWVGTLGDGLYRLDRESGSYTHYGPDEGLPEAALASLVEDDEGNLWASTFEGTVVSPVAGRLSRLDPKTGTFTNFDTQNGLPEIGFYPGAVMKSRTGMLFFGGDGGFTAFDPKTIREPIRTPPRIALEALHVFNDEVTPGPRAPIQKPIYLAEEIRLTAAQNDFTIDYAAFSFRDAGRTEYQYRLDDYDDGWVNARTLRSARYRRLPPGSYVFRVKAIDSRGLQSGEASIRVVTLPSPWETWWAYSLYAFVVAAVLFAVRRYELSRINLKNRLAYQSAEAENLRKIDTMKSRFFANISHEFRTPLTLILGPAQRLLEKNEDESDRRNLSAIQRNASRLLQLINQVLDLAKFDAGSMNIRVAQSDFIPFIRGIVMSFESLAQMRDIHLEFFSDIESLPLFFDPEKLSQVFNNLLSNAFKFTPEGGAVSVSVGLDGFSARIVFRDTGEGIPAELLPRIFDRFYQVEDSSVRRFEGTGIGLTLAKELVELHRGQLTVESEVGEGSTFTVSLLLGKEHFAPDEISTDTEVGHAVSHGEILPPAMSTTTTGHEASHDSDPDTDGRTLVLVIEDNADVRNFVRMSLEPDHHVAEAADGTAGIEKAKEIIPDLVISDLMMPGMDGYEVCRSLKSDERTSHIPVILLTARAELKDKIEGLETGADDYLTKPFAVDELRARIKNLIDVRRRLLERLSKEAVLEPAKVAVTSVDQAFLERVVETVESNLEREDFSLGDLSRDVAMSERQLRRKLKALTNQAPNEFIRSFRLQRARQLIEQEAGTISEIGYMVGFGSPSYFAKSFRDYFGKPPSEFLPKG